MQFVVTRCTAAVLPPPVLVYRCSEMADNCGECLALDPKFNCGWCKTTGQCEVNESCGAGWLDRNRACPNPQVSIPTPGTQFQPRAGTAPTD